MKTLYKSPVITVEELTKTDILCYSEEDPNTIDNGVVGVNSTGTGANVQTNASLSGVTNLL